MNAAYRTMSVLGVTCSLLVACASDEAGPTPSTAAPAVVATDASDTDTTGTRSTDDSSSPEVPSSDAPVTAPATSVDPAVDQVAAQAALLVLTDFDVGWSEVAPEEDDDADTEVKRRVAECAGADAPTAADFGGALAKTGTFTSPSEDQVAESVSFAATTAEAVERMARFDAPEFATCIQPVYEEFVEDNLGDSGAQLESVTVAKLNVTPAGDEMVAYRITITAGQSGLTQELYADIIVIRSGRVIASPTFQSQFSPFDIDETERLIALAAGRLPNG